MEERQALINGIGVNYKIAGQGPTILILHGWGRGSDSYVEVVEKLTRAGFQVVVPDLPGFGKSMPPATAWGVNEYVEFVKTFAAQLNLEMLVILGHSFGGQIALKFAVTYPEKLDRLILEAAAVIRRKRTKSKTIVQSLARIGSTFFSIWPLVVFQNIARKLFYRLLGSSDYLYTQGIMKDVRERVLGEDLSQLLSQVSVPTLILWGDNDSITPVEDAHTIQRQMPNATLQIIKGASHRLHIEMPDQFVSNVINFCYNNK